MAGAKPFYWPFICGAILLVALGFVTGATLAMVYAAPQSNAPLAMRWLYPLIPGRKPADYHLAPFANTQLFDAAFAAAKPAPAGTPTDVQALLVNHHLLAADLVAQAVNTVASTKSRTILLIAPNHFGQGKAPMITSAYDWRTAYGVLPTDDALVAKMQAVCGIATEEQPFIKEHGIYNIVPFLAHVMPQAKIVPLIVNDRVTIDQARACAQELVKLLPVDTLIVGSFDFSHDATDLSARFDDEKSLAMLSTFDTTGAGSINIDSKPGLTLFLELNKLRGAEDFHLFAQKNAFDYTHDASRTDVTSYLTGVVGPGQPVGDTTATVLAFGDIMLDRQVRSMIAEKGNAWPFANLTRFLKASDITVANLEGTVTSFPPKRLEPKGIVFTFDPSVVPTLTAVGINLVSQANNHSRDFGLAGWQQTQANLNKANLPFFGDYFNTEHLSYVENVRGRQIAFVGFHEFSHNNFQGVLDEIKRLRLTVDDIIVYPHWGVEYQPLPSKGQQDFAHQFIDAGADVVLGGHPHVVEPIEIYKNKLIVYSMGNFVFDQQFSEPVKHGLSVGLVFHDKSSEDQPCTPFPGPCTPGPTDVYLFPYSISKQFQVELEAPADAAKFYDDYAKVATASDDIKQAIKTGHFTINPQ